MNDDTVWSMPVPKPDDLKFKQCIRDATSLIKGRISAMHKPMALFIFYDEQVGMPICEDCNWRWLLKPMVGLLDCEIQSYDLVQVYDPSSVTYNRISNDIEAHIRRYTGE